MCFVARGSLSTGGGETASDLEGIVDDPLEASKGTNHEDSGTKTLPESVETNVGVDLSDGSTLLVHDGDHGVSWMRNNGAEDTGNVTRHEGDHELGGLAVLALWLGEDVAIEVLDDLLEGDELDNGVWDLSSPEWLDTLVELSTLSLHLSEASDGVSWELSWIRGLHFDLQLHI